MEFKELKEIYINICKDNDACRSETQRVHNSENKKELLQVVKDNTKGLKKKSKIKKTYCFWEILNVRC